MTGIIQIIFDDLGYQDFGCFGHPDLETPSIDAIATAGRKYTKLVVTPACSPTRASLLTGRLPQYWGMHAVDNPDTGDRHWLPPHTPTVGRRLQSIGWKTGHFGKTHWGAPPQTLHPADFGYDKFFGFPHGLPNAMFNGFTKIVNAYWHEDKNPPVKIDGYATDVIFDRAQTWILEQVAAGNDYYVEIWPHTPHEPETHDVDELSQYPAETYSERERYYYGVITHADVLIGDLVTALSNAGALSNTYIAVGSENGPEPHTSTFPHSAGLTAPWRGVKRSLYMGGIAVPWVMRGPGITAGSTDDKLRGGEDWAPTALEIAGYDMSEIVGGLPGSSLLSAAPDRYICREYHGRKIDGTTPPIEPNEWTCIKGDSESRWKLYRSSADGTGDKLFDLETDPGETTDVAGSNAAILAELQGELDAWVAEWADEVEANHTFDPEDPQTEEEAVAIKEPAEVTRLLIRCADGTDRTNKQALLEKALGYPREVPCSHGFDPVEVSEYGGKNVAHPTMLDFVCIQAGQELKDKIGDATVLARLTEAEQAEFTEMALDASAPTVP